MRIIVIFFFLIFKINDVSLINNFVVKSIVLLNNINIMKDFILFGYLLLLKLCIVFNAISQDLTKQAPIDKIILMQGITGEFHYFNPNQIELKTGKLYKLIIKSVSDSKHYFSSTLFSKAIFTRKIQVTLNGNKVAEIKGVINEIEVWPNHQIEWWLVPIKTGIFKDLNCRVVDAIKSLKHSAMGMKGVIIIK